MFFSGIIIEYFQYFPLIPMEQIFSENQGKKSFSSKKILSLFFSVGVILILSFFAFRSLPFFKTPEGRLGEFHQAYSLTNEVVSEGADIVLNIPEGMDKNALQDNIVFDPKIAGNFVETTRPQTIAFRPVETLEIGAYYSATLTTPTGEIQGEFKVIEPPRVLNIFPDEGAEADESGDITILFNAPMVPLTTLSELEKISPPVEMTPPTEGTWKWIGTRTLHFHPTDRLKRSSNYTVKVLSGFSSVDNLPLQETERHFITRPIRYENSSVDQIVFNQPYRLYFNQPVDLERTKKEITLVSKIDNKPIEFVAEYGKKKEGEKEIEDRSQILLFQKQDRNVRAKLWDFDTSYSISIAKVFPEEGDILLSDSFTENFTVLNIVANISASSERSDFSDRSFFDPKGKIEITFFEDIDLKNSQIIADKMTKIEYGQKCKQDETGVWYSDDIDCEKETDYSKIMLFFDAEKIGKKEDLQISLSKIVNTSGVQMNIIPLQYSLLSVPMFEIQEVFAGGDTSFMTLCTTTPLFIPETGEELSNMLKSEKDFKFIRFNPSDQIFQGQRSVCLPGAFATEVNYALLPEEDYSFVISVSDVFGEKREKTVSFRSGKMTGEKMFYSFQEAYTVTTPEKTKMTFAVQNMDFVNMEVCELSPFDMLYTLHNVPYYTDAALPKACMKKIEKRIDLSKKYWDKNFFQVQLSDFFPNTTGNFVLSFSNPEYKNYDNKPVYERTYISVSRIGVIQKEVQIFEDEPSILNLTDAQKKELKNLYWLTDLKTLSPLSGASVDLFSWVDGTPSSSGERERNIEKKETFLSNDFGMIEIEAFPNPAGAVVQKNGETAIVIGQDPATTLQYGSSAYNNKKTYLITDRPIYRPGDTVHVKGFFRQGYDGKFEFPVGEKLNITLQNSEYESVGSVDVPINDFGTFSADFVLDSSASLGTYYLELDVNGGYGYQTFDVEEYVPAPFKVNLTTNQEEYITGDTLQMDIGAEYYFGVPIENGTVEYTVVSQDYYFDKYTDEYFSFGSGWYSCWYDCSYGDKFLFSGQAKIDANGKASIARKIDISQFFKKEEDRKSKIFVVNMTVKNQNGQSVSTQKSFVVHAGDFYVGLKTDKSFLQKDESFSIRAKSVDTNGKELSVKKIALQLNKIEWQQLRRKEVDGTYYNKWEKKLTPVENKEFDTDEKGNWKGDFAIPSSGEFELSLRTTDRKGNVITSKETLYVYEKDSYNSNLVPMSNDNSLEIIAEKTDVKPGDIATILIKNPFQKAKALITIERGKIFEYKIVDISQNFYKYDFEVKKDYIPNIFISVTLLSADPAVKYGQVEFRVDTGEKDLQMNVKSDKENYLPGEKVNLDFFITDNDGKPVETELSVAVVDMSVLALKGNPKKNPVLFFYDNLPLTIETSSNLKNILHEIDIKKGKGGDGGNVDAQKKRGEFLDTAFWQAVIKTNAEGKATVSFVLPDNLTQWQVESIGITKDTKVGVGYKEFITRKEIMVVPVKPRFVIPGDELELGAKIFNQSENTQNFEVSFESDTLVALEEKSQKISLEKGETELVYFKIRVPSDQQTGVHTFTFSAKNNGNLEDTVEQKIKITRNDTYEATATAGSSMAKSEKEYLFLPSSVIPDLGKIEINSSATLAVFLSKGLSSLFAYPYGSAEQIASKLEAIAVVKKGLRLENIGSAFTLPMVEFEGEEYPVDEAVKRGLAKLLEAQNFEGGFRYYKNFGDPDFSLTAHVVETLLDLQEAGYEVPKDSIEKGLVFMESKAKEKDSFSSLSRNDILLMAPIFAKAKKDSSFLNEKIRAILKDEKFLQEDAHSLALSRLAIVLSSNPKEFAEGSAEKIFKILETRIKIDSRGSHLPVAQNLWWEAYETPEKVTASYIKAISLAKRDTPLKDNVLRWLLKSRTKDGSWGSTNSTISVIDAMVEYMTWQQENKSDFSLNVLVDGEQKGIFDFNPKTLLDQKTVTLAPLNTLSLGKILPIEFQKTPRNENPNRFYYDILLKYFLPIDAIPPRDEGFVITRDFYALTDTKFEKPLKSAKVGDVIRGHITILVPEERNFVSIEDFIPAGVELINFNLATENKDVLISEETSYSSGEISRASEYSYLSEGDGGNANQTLYPDFTENHDDRLFLVSQSLSPGSYTFDYYARVLVPGKFHHLPAVVSEMYFPENFGRTSGEYFEVTK